MYSSCDSLLSRHIIWFFGFWCFYFHLTAFRVRSFVTVFLLFFFFLVCISVYTFYPRLSSFWFFLAFVCRLFANAGLPLASSFTTLSCAARVIHFAHYESESKIKDISYNKKLLVHFSAHTSKTTTELWVNSKFWMYIYCIIELKIYSISHVGQKSPRTH